MPDYSKSKIYKITSPHTSDIYIGSTVQKLSKRKAGHQEKYKIYLQTNDKHHYTTSFKLIELGPVDICLLEEYPCQSKEQLHARERYYIENNQCVNKYIPSRTDKEYYEDNKESILSKDKIRNREKYTCECGATINRQHHVRHENSERHIKAMKSIPI